MHRFRFLMTVALIASVANVSVGRTWTDAAGQNQVEAELLTIQFGKVWLRRADGKIFGVQATELSDADRQYIREFQRKRRSAPREVTHNPAGRVPYGPGYELARLANQAIDESSGVACSRRASGFFWTHNDSGGNASVYLFDMKGRDLGSCRVDVVFAFDWEDMFSCRRNGKNYLVLCDVGNNGRAAPIQMLHVIEEPAFDAEKGVTTQKADVVQTIFYGYDDDWRDCEAVGYDLTSDTILLIAKERDVDCNVYALKWPESGPKKVYSARRIASLPLRLVTALDVSPDGRRAVVLTYRDAYEYVRAADASWSQAFTWKPRKIIVPERIQGESLCFGADGKTLFLTSEKCPTPLLTVPVLKQ